MSNITINTKVEDLTTVTFTLTGTREEIEAWITANTPALKEHYKMGAYQGISLSSPVPEPPTKAEHSDRYKQYWEMQKERDPQSQGVPMPFRVGVGRYTASHHYDHISAKAAAQELANAEGKPYFIYKYDDEIERVAPAGESEPEKIEPKKDFTTKFRVVGPDTREVGNFDTQEQAHRTAQTLSERNVGKKYTIWQGYRYLETVITYKQKTETYPESDAVAFTENVPVTNEEKT